MGGSVREKACGTTENLQVCGSAIQYVSEVRERREPKRKEMDRKTLKENISVATVLAGMSFTVTKWSLVAKKIKTEAVDGDIEQVLPSTESTDGFCQGSLAE